MSTQYQPLFSTKKLVSDLKLIFITRALNPVTDLSFGGFEVSSEDGQYKLSLSVTFSSECESEFRSLASTRSSIQGIKHTKTIPLGIYKDNLEYEILMSILECAIGGSNLDSLKTNEAEIKSIFEIVDKARNEFILGLKHALEFHVKTHNQSVERFVMDQFGDQLNAPIATYKDHISKEQLQSLEDDETELAIVTKQIQELTAKQNELSANLTNAKLEVIDCLVSK
ncbi:hypothetical protein QX249_10780 [Vibrio parahaemolyticus]|uniref:Uncharacterized protein n=1 Tax=Vibrio parahaemolyticus TaxID=670 RepID=A0AAW8PYP0_VIBPH|nr:hypothetical protein [Vibrio parahaemolyticus]MDS1821146.1 hypothetical protein [Vibrio parahaemolyticus]